MEHIGFRCSPKFLGKLEDYCSRMNLTKFEILNMELSINLPLNLSLNLPRMGGGGLEGDLYIRGHISGKRVPVYPKELRKKDQITSEQRNTWRLKKFVYMSFLG